MLPSSAGLDVLLEDGPVLAVNKPAGLLTQGVPRGIPTLEAQVRAYVKERYAKPGNVYLGIPHRLDRPTSGAIVFARNSKAAARLAEQFENRQVRKEYLAIVEGTPGEVGGDLADWLLKEPERAHVNVVPAGTPGAKEARLRYRVLETRDGRSLLHLEPLTGRMHQLRVQLAARGWPVVGDVQYGGESRVQSPESREEREPLDSAPSSSAIALHASRLTILHPVRYDELPISAPVPSFWSAFGFQALSE
jgi:23S rRNA pseudouridine1911/1915/1917 synthase